MRYPIYCVECIVQYFLWMSAVLLLEASNLMFLVSITEFSSTSKINVTPKGVRLSEKLE